MYRGFRSLADVDRLLCGRLPCALLRWEWNTSSCSPQTRLVYAMRVPLRYASLESHSINNSVLIARPVILATSRRLYSNGTGRQSGTIARLVTKSWHPANLTKASPEDVSVPVYLTHGLLGYKEEFDPFGQKIADATGRIVTAFDARNHGESEHVEQMDYISMGDDLAGYMKENGVQKAIFISHSMGAGTSLVLAIRKPSLVHALMLIDVAVVNAPRVRQLVAFLQMMRGIRFQPEISLDDNRQMAAKIMTVFEVEEFLIERTLPNIVEKDGVIQWRVDLPVLIRDIYNLTQIPAGFLAEKLEYKRPLHILQAGLSGYITPEGRQQTKELLPRTQFQEFLLLVTGFIWIVLICFSRLP